MWGKDRKIRPSGLPFVITRQAAGCQPVILGTEFSILRALTLRIDSYNLLQFQTMLLSKVSLSAGKHSERNWQ